MAKKRARRRNHPLPAFRDYVVRFLDDGWGKSGAESAAAMKRHAGLVEGSWKAGEPAEHVAEVIAKSEHWRKATKAKRRRSNPRRPPRKWMKRCTKAVSRKGGAKKAGAVCAATWKRKAASERKKAVAEERRRARRANAGAAARHRRALQEASVKGAASALRRLGYRVKIERGRPR